MTEQSVTNCGLCGIYPKWLQKRATPHTFILVYGFLGLVQAMAFVYMLVTLTTLEKRFKIPSQTTGIILSGNEISQILSLILMYYGGAGHRPRWLAAGVGFSALSCLILAIPHLLYGPGKAALALTQEHLDKNLPQNVTISTEYLSLCPGEREPEECDEDDMGDAGITPRILVFLSQFVLGIGTTLYFGLGQTYLDDNTKKSSTPMLLGITFALRTTGPALGFILAYVCMKLYIVPNLHPVINDKDPRWLGAWWLGWIILGILLAVFALLIAMFPRHLPKKPKKDNMNNNKPEGEVPLRITDRVQGIVEAPRIIQTVEKIEIHTTTVEEEAHVPTLSDFGVTLKRVFSNKILLCNNLSAVFSIFGFLPYMTYMAKYLEVQFNTSAAGGTVITGPIALTGMVLGFIGSGFFISKMRPRPTRLLSWNVVGGFVCVLVQIVWIFNSCPVMPTEGIDSTSATMNFTTACNIGCNCERVKYSPVCHRTSMITYFSACHAGCTSSIDSRTFGNCSCVPDYLELNETQSYSVTPPENTVTLGPCLADCVKTHMIFAITSMINQFLLSTGKIGNVLVNYRCVEKRDKSVAQGVTLMFVSLFALIPGPILYGAIIDQTCLIWEDSCGSNGNCWHYDKDKFRWSLNATAMCFTFLGVLFDVFVCHLGKDLDLYGTEEEDQRKVFIQEDTVITRQTKTIILKPEKKL
ncbi:solute carrier organic anion transporter family member 4C1 [Diachasma alloeum]|uniref:solute carrier organic anion transporter family member 4C1 n=1 Tax=Diachasma alloeum TaxID=454923 RepID=UPI000738314C|nr:solute carrier organic anion transporter family member 4C1 [Diachasma alloeum]XP_015111745.1 solute carrier organic anion transporter family member 4C1 [Diachasma alloeum]XP_015111746.1 solute carrier organic anion transporter family member 4C1 [Diachasma alloeum]XP_015111747.1 solute carrier organic anion transporter family member 4C1 [Diachasma alloeum]XP_015111748.1 solute carrier organic anion transporter family member 4C1 [Diachasma alloeum]